MKSSKRIAIAIDGPAGAGKSTVSKAVAQALNYSLVDTGAIYRSVAFLAKQQNTSWQDEQGLAQIIAEMTIQFAFHDNINRVTLNGKDVSSLIRSPEISKGASVVSQLPAVRAGLLALQRGLAGNGGAVLEGRDIGTVVFPDAPVKIFLDASSSVRAQRRFDELSAKGEAASYEEIHQEIEARDKRDRTREIAPLKPAKDAILIDSSDLSPKLVVERILEAVRIAITTD